MGFLAHVRQGKRVRLCRIIRPLVAGTFVAGSFIPGVGIARRLRITALISRTTLVCRTGAEQRNEHENGNEQGKQSFRCHYIDPPNVKLPKRVSAIWPYKYLMCIA